MEREKAMTMTTAQPAAVDAAATADEAVVAAAKQVVKDKQARINKSSARRPSEEEQREAKQLDEQLRRWAKIAADNFVRVTGLIAEAKEKAIWKLVDDPETGKPFRTWQSYIASVIGREMEPLAAVNRNALVKMLLDEGLSQRAAAEAAKTSPATVNEVAKGKTPGEPRPSGQSRQNSGQPSSPPPRRSFSSRAIEFLDDVAVRGFDQFATSDLENFEKKLRTVHGQVVANLKIRKAGMSSKAASGRVTTKRAEAAKESAKQSPVTKRAEPTKATQSRQAAKRRHPAGSKTPADAA